ncbi:MAG: BREX-1 system phosphatase PglZ type B, partial [Dissulfurispiraceae bacterium]
MNDTVFDAIVASLQKAAAYNPNDQVAPAVILWTDHDRQWEPLISLIRSRLPQLLTLGPYELQARTGPAIWLRAMIARKLPDADWPAEAVPIIYLPGTSRQQLRAVEECAKELQPLAELQYRGVFWTQVNAKDWTLCALLKSDQGGLGLEVARDNDSKEALRRCLLRLVEEPVERLRGRRLDAAFFNSLLTPDPIRDLLDWLNSPEATQKRWDEETWTAFCIVCRKTYKFDPVKEGPLVAAEKLGHRNGTWQAVWNRFAEAPTLYPGIPNWLERARPSNPGAFTFFDDKEPWPQENALLEG